MLRQRLSEERRTKTTRIHSLRDPAVIEISLLVPTTPDELAMIGGIIPSTAKGSLGAAILKAVHGFLDERKRVLPRFTTVRARARDPHEGRVTVTHPAPAPCSFPRSCMAPGWHRMPRSRSLSPRGRPSDRSPPTPCPRPGPCQAPHPMPLPAQPLRDQPAPPLGAEATTLVFRTSFSSSLTTPPSGRVDPRRRRRPGSGGRVANGSWALPFPLRRSAMINCSIDLDDYGASVRRCCATTDSRSAPPPCG